MADLVEGKPLKRFLVFAHMNYYPGGGMSDMKGHFDELDQAVELAKELKRYDYVEVFDITTCQEVWSN